MTEQERLERKRRIQRREKARRRRRLQYIVMAILAIVIVALCVVFFSMVRKNKSSADETAGQNQTEQTTPGGDASQDASPAATEEPTEPPVKTITLTQEQMHTGDLILVNSTYAYDFDANAASVDLVNINDAKTGDYTVAKADMQLSSRVIPHLDEMIAGCNDALGVNDTGVTSAYRSKEYQQSVYDEYAETQGEDYAKAYVATPGYSEHHTGLAMDMGIYYSGGGEGSFSESENAVWFSQNSYKYGFVRRYAEDKTDITKINNEAWHFRYVGLPHAHYMYENNLCLEEYIDYLRSNTSEESPLQVEVGGGLYSVYFTAETTIKEPENSYEVSGNNVDGYIITADV